LGLNDRVNTDRIEIIKGPNAAIYGSTSPAGLINYVSVVPNFRTTERVSFIAGGNEFNRAELSFNSPLGSLGGVKFAQRFSAAGNNESSETTFGRTRNRVLAESVL